MAGKERIFKIDEESIQHYLFADESEDEDGLPWDEEDKEVLTEDIDKVEDKIIIEHPVGKPANITVVEQASKSESVLNTVCSWSRPKGIARVKNSFQYPYGKVTLSLSKSKDSFEIFEKTDNFNSLVELIIQQSILYMEQKGVPFTTNSEGMKAFLGMNLVMGYHVLPKIRDYWSTNPDLSCPYLANVMPRARFEAIRSALHFANNNEMLRREDVNYDRAFKVKPFTLSSSHSTV
ncbi:hypothetical protein J437_LFUL005769 [Ladona fulva]|uniref:PiggyBac transposable element-derived protein domain-containing protein n=1 Tax=Ladona fulva TaxID=123851 RepID=A0A8K0P040_LADFU|nr:hypothetical protein J437_LFUL005769 [Ladona fulva]